jgi:prophage antirepressor-like protein
MNELKIFENQDFGSIRTLEEDGKILFCGRDVAAALGYKDTTNAMKQHCRGVVKRHLTDSLGRDQETNFIPEGDLYRLAAKSELDGADKFERWIFDEVLPSIRKHGAYLTPEKIEEVLLNPDTIIRLATDLKEERNRRIELENVAAQQRQLLAEFSPKASYYDVVLQTQDVLSATQVAKDYGKSAQWLNDYLHEKGIQYKQGGVWLLYQKYAEQGYTKSRTNTFSGSDGMQHSNIHTYWTQKGRLFIYDLLKSDGILPTMERQDKAGKREVSICLT